MDKVEKCVLSFGDIVLRENDLKSLENGRWLTDHVISFAFEYLYKRTLNDIDKSRICCLSASVCQLIKMMDGPEVAQVLDDLELEKKEHALLAVNDHDDPSSSGGSHWSLLIYRCTLRPHFLIVDSLQGKDTANREPTNKVIRTLAHHFKLPAKDTRIEKATKQLNTVDCGMFVIENARLYVESLKRGEVDVDFTQLDPSEMKKRRKAWCAIIRSLAEEEN